MGKLLSFPPQILQLVQRNTSNSRQLDVVSNDALIRLHPHSDFIHVWLLNNLYDDLQDLQCTRL